MKDLTTYDEFINESKIVGRKKIQFIKVSNPPEGTNNERLSKLTAKCSERFFEVFLESDHKDLMEVINEIDSDRPMIVYAGDKNSKTEKFILECSEKNPDMIYNLPEQMRKVGSKVDFHKIFDKKEYLPKTVFKIEEATKLKFPIIAKPTEGHSGVGIEKFDSIDDLKSSKNKFDLYSEFVDFKREFRALCVKDKAIVVYERQLVEADNKSIETKNADETVSFIYIDQDMSKLSFKKDLDKIVGEFIEEVPLGVYSIDFFEDVNGSIKVIEANSCTGLGANSLVHVYEAVHNDFYGFDIPTSDKQFIANVKKTNRDIVKRDYPNEHKKSLSPKLDK